MSTNVLRSPRGKTGRETPNGAAERKTGILIRRETVRGIEQWLPIEQTSYSLHPRAVNWKHFAPPTVLVHLSFQNTFIPCPIPFNPFHGRDTHLVETVPLGFVNLRYDVPLDSIVGDRILLRTPQNLLRIARKSCRRPANSIAVP